MKKAVRTPRTRVDRVHRQLQLLPEAAQTKGKDLLQRTDRILIQRTKDKNKLYALHAPEVECISKSKARTPYEFGAKVQRVRVPRSGQKRGMTKTLKAMIKRRCAIEPAIGHMRMDGRLARNPLKGALGDAIHAVMCGARLNQCLILTALRLYCVRFWLSMQTVSAALIAAQVTHPPACRGERNCSGRTDY